ncbi:MAG: hypothetical protein AAGL69_15295 [Pseudomonadota bacterium]
MSDLTRDLFPLGIATGPAFCNREVERDTLKRNIRAGRHSWIWARRRIGKTSLVEQVILELSQARPAIHAARLDCNIVHDADSLDQALRKSVASLAIAMSPGARSKAQALLAGVFARFQPSFQVGPSLFQMRLNPTETPAANIAEVLLALDDLASSLNRRAVVVLDEFQQVSRLTHGRKDTTLEGAIRHAVERAKRITYVFSGSERSLLADMFENADRPLYHHSRKMSLGRISAEHYFDFLNNAARARWQKPLSDKVIALILKRSQRQPFYVNSLCSRLWDARRPPSQAAVESAWAEVVEESTPVVAERVRSLSATQRALLIGIANAGRVEQPTSQAFLAEIRLSASTGSNAKDVLEANDFIRPDLEGGWFIVDPVMYSYLRSE